MGFYGNITNTARTQFAFDRTYQNRAAMERAMQTDGVFIGRYVLIEYDSNSIDSTIYQQAYRHSDYDDDKVLYLSNEPSVATRITYSSTGTYYDVNGKPVLSQGVGEGTIVYVQEESFFLTYYECRGQNEGYAVFYPLTTDSSYAFNYAVDKAWAIEKGYTNIGRGWDSTVWQKTYQNGVEKYVMIAELNTVVPSFGISADAPSISPLMPHFGVNSTNMYYNLHWQPAWALRPRAADASLILPGLDESGHFNGETIKASDITISTPSDLEIEWIKSEHDKTTDTITKYKFNALTQEWQALDLITMDDEEYLDENGNKIHPFKIPAAIYFNKDGFNVDKIAYSADLVDATSTSFNEKLKISKWSPLENKIALEPTGYSGHKYNNHENNLQTNFEPDTQELSIMLPALGDTIAHMWDLIYGGRESSDQIRISSERNKNIEWEDASRGGEKTGLRLIHRQPNKQYTYDVSQVDTLAGCINSAHDILGMIITDELLDEQGIQTADESWIYYNSGDGTYNRKHKIYTYPLDGELEDYKTIELTQFNTNLNYFEKRNNNYLKLTEPAEHINYYQLQDPHLYGTFEDSFAVNKYYYKQQISGTDIPIFKYILETDLEPHGTREYVSLHEYDNDKHIIQSPQQHQFYFWSDAGYFYFLPNELDDNQDISAFEASHEVVPTEGRTYYYKYETHTATSLFTQFVPIPQNQLVVFEQNKYYEYEDGNYIPITSLPITQNHTQIVTCYTLPYKRENLRFYQAGVFYYISNDNYLLDLSTDYTEGREYYTPEFRLITDINFYLPNKYYYFTNNKYILDDSVTLNTNRTYYEKQLHYVAQDTAGAFPVGSIWNDNITNIPPTVTLCNREESWELTPIPGFSDDLNTLYGLILHINNILEYGDVYTRDRNTVQGSINILHDIIAKFEILNPTDVMITDEYGRIRGAQQTTAQSYGYTNIGTNETITPGTAQEDQWIYWNVNANVLNPQITLAHQSHTVSDTTTTSDKNTNLGSGLNIGIGDTINLYTPIVDNTGHIVGKNTETVTLPFGFKILKSLAQSEDDNIWTSAAGAELEITADSTQDTLSLATGNKWVRVIADINLDKLTIAHETHTVTPTTSTATLSNETSAAVTFEVPTYTFDAAGHYNELDTKTFTMPFAYGKFNGDSGTAIASATFDTLTIASADSWLSTAADTDTLLIAHEYPGDHTDTTSISDLNSSNDTLDLEQIIWDGTGHVLHKNTETVTLPYSFKTFVVNPQSTAVSQLALGIDNVENPTNENNIVASATKDTFTFATGNKWLRIATDNINKKLTIAHSVTTIPTSTASRSLSSTVASFTNANFDIPVYSYDEAGHITSLITTTYTIPNSFGIIQGDLNNGVLTSGEAAQTHDTLILNGDAWIKTAVSNQTVMFTHQDPVSTVNTAKTDVSLTFGDSFTVDDWFFDNKGHKNELKTHQLTLPSITIANETVGNPPVEIVKTDSNIVVNLLPFDNTTGVLTQQRADLTSIKLNGFVKNYFVDSTDTLYTGEVSDTDTLGIALAKLSNDTKALKTALIGMDDTTIYEPNKLYFLTRDTNGLNWIALETWTIGGSY